MEETIEGRYTPVRAILEEQLTLWYGAGNFKIIVGRELTSHYHGKSNKDQQPRDDYGKWKVEVPRKMEYVRLPTFLAKLFTNIS